MREDVWRRSVTNVAPRVAAASWLLLIVLCVAWEAWLAPQRPGGSWLVLKALPLVFVVPGLLRARSRTMQAALLLVHAYLAEGLVRVFEPGVSGMLAAGELLLATVFFAAAAIHLYPQKQAARARRRAAAGRPTDS